MKPATTKARALLAKLQALAERGVNGEQESAKRKLARLRATYDFSAPDPEGPDLFAGQFQRATEAARVAVFSTGDFDIANSVKWAIEQAAKIPCLFRQGELYAQATPATATRLHGIASVVADNFAKLWAQYRATPGSNPADRGNFILGLYEGMMNEERHNERLPARLAATRSPKAKRKAIGHAPGLSLHPYTVAAALGKRIRFCVPLDDIAGELDRTIKGEIGS